MERSYNLIDVVKVLFHWRRPIIYTCFAVAIGTAVISLFLPNYYEAETTFLAASPDQSQPELFFNKGGLRTFIYGNDDDMDRLLTLAQSHELVDHLVKKFDLYVHYKIDTTNKKAPYRVKKKFFKYYDIKKTDKDALVLSFEDKDPEFAAVVCNEARRKINETAQKLLKNRQQTAIKALEKNLTNKRDQLRILSDTLQRIRREYGIFNPLAQTESLSEKYDLLNSKLVKSKGRLNVLETLQGIPQDTIKMLSVEIKGIQDQVDTLKTRLEKVNQGLPLIETYEKQYVEANESLSEDQEQLKQYYAVFNAEIPSLIVIEEAEVPVIKSRPRRSIIVIAAGLAAFIFSVIGVLLIDAYKDIKWQEVFKDEK